MVTFPVKARELSWTKLGSSFCLVRDTSWYSNHWTCIHRMTKERFVGPHHLPNIWGKKLIATTKVPLTSHQNFKVLPVIRLKYITQHKLTDFFLVYYKHHDLYNISCNNCSVQVVRLCLVTIFIAPIKNLACVAVHLCTYYSVVINYLRVRLHQASATRLRLRYRSKFLHLH